MDSPSILPCSAGRLGFMRNAMRVREHPPWITFPALSDNPSTDLLIRFLRIAPAQRDATTSRSHRLVAPLGRLVAPPGRTARSHRQVPPHQPGNTRLPAGQMLPTKEGEACCLQPALGAPGQPGQGRLAPAAPVNVRHYGYTMVNMAIAGEAGDWLVNQYRINL